MLLFYVWDMICISLTVTVKEKPVGHAKRYTKDDKGVKAYHHKCYQITREGSVRGTRNKGSTKQSENNERNGSSKSLCIARYFKCKSVKFSNQKSWNGSTDVKT